MENLQKIKNIYESEAVIKNCEDFVGKGLWNIGSELKYIRDNKTYIQKGYSDFEEYVESELDYSRQHTYNFINIAEKYSVQSIGQMGHLGISKLVALAKLDETAREEFIDTTHIINGEMKTVDEMTSRELQRVIKEKQQAEEENARLKSEKRTMENENLLIKGQAEYYKGLTATKEETIQNLIKNKPAGVAEPVVKIPDDYEAIKERLKEAEEKAKDTSEKLKTRDKQLKETEDELKAIRDSKKALIGTGQETDLNLTDLTTIINKLIKDLTPLKYQSYVFEQADDTTKNKWFQQLSKVDELLLDIKSAIHGGTCIASYKVE